MNVINLMLLVLSSVTVTTAGTHVTLKNAPQECWVAVQVFLPAGWDYEDRVIVLVDGALSSDVTPSIYARRIASTWVRANSPKVVTVQVIAKGDRKPVALFRVRVKE